MSILPGLSSFPIISSFPWLWSQTWLVGVQNHVKIGRGLFVSCIVVVQWHCRVFGWLYRLWDVYFCSVHFSKKYCLSEFFVLFPSYCGYFYIMAVLCSIWSCHAYNETWPFVFSTRSFILPFFFVSGLVLWPFISLVSLWLGGTVFPVISSSISVVEITVYTYWRQFLVHMTGVCYDLCVFFLGWVRRSGIRVAVSYPEPIFLLGWKRLMMY